MAQYQGFPTVMYRRDHCPPSNILRKCYNNTITINIATYTLHGLCIVLPSGLRQKHKAPGQVLTVGTAQQYTEVSTLLLVQGLAQCREIVHICMQLSC